MNAGPVPEPTVRLVVAEDQPVVRQGLVMLLEAQPDFRVVGEAGTGREAVREAHRLRPDVVLMDLRMPGGDGAEATRAIVADAVRTEAGQPVRVLVLTTFDDEDAVRGALQAGASGFVLKHAAPRELTTAVRRVAAGDGWLDPVVAPQVIAALRAAPRPRTASGVLERLTPRELEILELMARGLSNDEIAGQLVLSTATVKTHVSHVIMKTGCRDRTEAVVLAYAEGLLAPG